MRGNQQTEACEDVHRADMCLKEKAFDLHDGKHVLSSEEKLKENLGRLKANNQPALAVSWGLCLSFKSETGQAQLYM